MSRQAPRHPPERVELSVIAPCFNEEGNVTPLVSRLLAVFERRTIAGEVVLVNDCSTDATGRIIDDLAAKHPEVRVVHHPENRGLAAAWNTGLAAATGTYVCFIDADLQNPPEEVWRLYREITQSRVDMVQGVRSSIGRLRDGRYVTSRVLNLILNLTFGMSATDNKSGFVMALRETMTDILKRRFRYRHSHVFIAVAAHARGFTFREVETLFQNRHAGESFVKHWPVKLTADVCWDTVKAFVEFRLSEQPIEGVNELLQMSNGAPGHAPTPVGGVFRALRSPRRMRRMQDALMHTQWATPSQIRQLQEVRLRRLMRHACHHVQYYRDVFERLQIRPDEIKTLGDLRRLPLLSPQDVRENLYFDLFADNHRKRDMHKVTTVRPGREPLEIYVDRIQLEMQRAGRLRARGRTGAVARERAWIACDCEAAGGHHVAAESYIVEVLQDGTPVAPGEEGDVVITDLNSFSVPLIRYQVGDRAVALDDAVCACGRGLPKIGQVREPQPVEVMAP